MQDRKQAVRTKKYMAEGKLVASSRGGVPSGRRSVSIRRHASSVQRSDKRPSTAEEALFKLFE
jgi:hypothetical protein